MKLRTPTDDGGGRSGSGIRRRAGRPPRPSVRSPGPPFGHGPPRPLASFGREPEGATWDNPRGLAAAEGRDAGAYADARRWIRERFPRGEAEERVEELDRGFRRDDAFEDALELHEEWDELRRSAPPLFPARMDRAARRHLDRLRRHVERSEEGAPGVAEARRLLERHGEE